MFKKSLLIMLLMALFAPWAANAQVVTIGTDNSNHANLPFKAASAYGFTEQLYTKTEIADAGGYAGKITKVTFKNNGTVKTRNIDIYMIHTTKTKFSSDSDWVQVTSSNKVFSGSVTFPGYEYKDIELQTAFAWNGDDNIIICVDDNTGSSSAASAFSVYGSTSGTTYYSINYAASSDIDPSTIAVYGNALTRKNHIKLTFAPNCPSPTSVAVNQATLGQTSATLTWSVDGDSNDFQYVLSTTELDASGLAAATKTDVEDATSVTINTLSQNTHYYFYVRTNCGGSDGTSGWASCEFTTLPQHPVPTNLEITSVTAHTATIGWTAPNVSNVENYTYEYKLASGDWDNSSDVTSVTTSDASILSAELASLVAESNYDFRVRANYAEGSSDWVTDDFTTDIACPAPENLTANDVTSTSATLTWTGSSSNYDIYVIETNDVPNASTDPTYTTTETSKDLVLTENHTYYAWVRANCSGSNDGTSDWVGPCSFTASNVHDFTVNNGEATNQYVPIDLYYTDNANTATQFIIPASSLTTMTNSNISRIVFYNNSNLPSTNPWGYNKNAPTVNVYLKEVENSTFASAAFLDWPSTYVYQGQITINADKEWVIDLPESFKYYDGNLMVGVSVATAEGYSNNKLWYGITSTGSSVSKSGSGSITQRNFLPKTTFTYEKDLTPACDTPENLAVSGTPTYNSVTLIWDAIDGVAGYEVYISENATAPEDATSGVFTATNTYTNSTLDENSDYHAWVRTKCGENNYSRWTSTAVDFSTLCDVTDVDSSHPFSEDFTSSTFPPECWTLQSSNSNNWSRQYRTGNTATYMATAEADGNLELRTPTLNISGGAAILSFWTKNYNSTGSGKDIVNIISGGMTTELWSRTTPNTTWSEVTISLNSYVNQDIVIIFRYEAEGSSITEWYVDDITITAYDKAVSAGNWPASSAPTATDNVILTGAVVIPSGTTANANSITLGEGASLTIKDGGQLICNNSVNATLEKEIDAAVNWNTTGADAWYLIASPVNGFATNNIVAGTTTTDLYSYNEPTNYWFNAQGTTNPFTSLTRGNGYLYANNTGNDLTFIGEMPATNTNIEKTLSYECSNESLKGFNLVGNPFTCNLTSDNVKIHNGTELTNITSYLIVENGTELTTVTDFANNPIKPGRGFFVQANDEGQKVVFNPGAKRGEATAKPSFINIEAGNESFMDRACVQIGQGNTLRKMTINDQVSHVYVINDGKDYAAATIMEAQGEMPVSFRANENGQYTLTVNAENVEMNYLHLIDNMTGADIDLLQTPSYTFNATTTDYESRFRLVFAANNEDGSSTGSETFAFYSNGNWIINNVGEATLQVIDLTGRILSSETVNGSVSTTINATPGVYMIRLVNGENVKVQKIVVR